MTSDKPGTDGRIAEMSDNSLTYVAIGIFILAVGYQVARVLVYLEPQIMGVIRGQRVPAPTAGGQGSER
jgi:hypothetical protein